MIDLNSKTRLSHAKRQEFKKAFVAIIDNWTTNDRKQEPEREYLGASEIGKCERALCFSFTKTPKDPGKELTGQQIRRFIRGNTFEKLMLKWMQDAGFQLKTQSLRNGRTEQLGFQLIYGKFAGHIDGLIKSGPPKLGPFELHYPCLWESKALYATGWRKLDREGVKKTYPEYYDQCQIYMAYMQLDENPALFTAINADSMEIYTELVPFDLERAQELSDKAVRIIDAVESGNLLPKPYPNRDFYKCKWCDWQNTCWDLPY